MRSKKLPIGIQKNHLCSMIPYFEWNYVQIGPLTLYVWGFFVALGILLGLQVARVFARQHGLKDGLIIDTAMGAVAGGIIGARLAYVLFYNPNAFIVAPLKIFALWDGGMSMTGALVGALAILYLILKRAKAPIAPYLDAIAFGLPLGYGFGRIGCFLIHDHPGTATHFFLGVTYPDGIVRHDHGLYLSLFGFLVALIFAFTYTFARHKKWNITSGSWVASYFVIYGAVRFWLDFYRIQDMVYAGLTPAQWIAILFVLGGCIVLWHLYKKR